MGRFKGFWNPCQIWAAPDFYVQRRQGRDVPRARPIAQVGHVAACTLFLGLILICAWRSIGEQYILSHIA